MSIPARTMTTTSHSHVTSLPMPCQVGFASAGVPSWRAGLVMAKLGTSAVCRGTDAAAQDVSAVHSCSGVALSSSF